MRGEQEVRALQQRLDASFERVKALTDGDHELLSDFAKYLCILVSGYFETALAELATEHCRVRSAPTVSSYSDRQLGRLQNVNPQRLRELLGSFNPAWHDELDKFIDGRRQDALGGVLNLRNKIAHGESVTITYSRIKEYYKSIQEIVDFLIVRFA
jgi:hypothetical protein